MSQIRQIFPKCIRLKISSITGRRLLYCYYPDFHFLCILFRTSCFNITRSSRLIPNRYITIIIKHTLRAENKKNPPTVSNIKCVYKNPKAPKTTNDTKMIVANTSFKYLVIEIPFNFLAKYILIK